MRAAISAAAATAARTVPDADGLGIRVQFHLVAGLAAAARRIRRDALREDIVDEGQKRILDALAALGGRLHEQHAILVGETLRVLGLHSTLAFEIRLVADQQLDD